MMIASHTVTGGKGASMAIDLDLYEKYSGRTGDPRTRLGQALAKLGLTNPQGHSGTGHAKNSTPAPNPTPAQSQRPRKPGIEI